MKTLTIDQINAIFEEKSEAELSDKQVKISSAKIGVKPTREHAKNAADARRGGRQNRGREQYVKVAMTIAEKKEATRQVVRDANSHLVKIMFAEPVTSKAGKVSVGATAKKFGVPVWLADEVLKNHKGYKKIPVDPKLEAKYAKAFAAGPQPIWSETAKNFGVDYMELWHWAKRNHGGLPRPQGVRDEVKQKLRESCSGYVHIKITCPHCRKTGGETSMKRWHFNNCKEKK